MNTSMWWTWYALLVVGPMLVLGLLMKDWLTTRGVMDVVRNGPVVPHDVVRNGAE